jgi:AcrR family transcriptional regulator
MTSPLETFTERRAGRPTSEETERLNEEILEAAFRLFTLEGVGGASIERIAKESRTTRRSVLSRFPDKKALLLAAVEMRTWRFLASITPPEPMLVAKPLDTLREVCRLMLEAVVTEESVRFLGLCLSHMEKFPEVGAIGLRFNDRMLADLEVLIRRAQRSGAFKGRDPATMATGLVGIFISNPLNRTALGDPQFRDPVTLGRYFDGLWGYVLDAL